MDAEVPARRWSRLEYEQLVDDGFFGPDDRIELIDGALLVKEPQSSAHVTAVALVHEALRIAFGLGWFVRVPGPVALDENSEPEPDVSVVPGTARDYRDAHPSRPVLVVEVSQSRLRFDRTHKAAIYARAGVADYWIVNLVDRVLEVHREPSPSVGSPGGWGYRAIQRLDPDAIASPLAAPAARIVVADLLP
jgi:Uma2 family endonuclease